MSPLNVPAAHGDGIDVAASQVEPAGHGRQADSDVTPVAPCRATSDYGSTTVQGGTMRDAGKPGTCPRGRRWGDRLSRCSSNPTDTSLSKQTRFLVARLGQGARLCSGRPDC